MGACAGVSHSSPTASSRRLLRPATGVNAAAALQHRADPACGGRACLDHRARELATLRWGLPPSWPGAPPALINARSETAADKPAFRDSFRKRRCLVPASGFYEWQKRPGGRKQPFLFRRADNAPIAVAGLWDGGACALLTTAADVVVAPVHDRMPLILAQADFARWLDPDTALADLRGLSRPGVEAGLLGVAVGSWVNDARHEGPRCVEPADQDLFEQQAR
jgi:putative SOS response-associated peptidase YedK